VELEKVQQGVEKPELDGLSSEGSERVIDTVLMHRGTYLPELIEIGKKEGFSVQQVKEEIESSKKGPIRKFLGLSSPSTNLNKMKLSSFSRDYLAKTLHIEDIAILRNSGSAYSLGKAATYYPKITLNKIYQFGDRTLFSPKPPHHQDSSSKNPQTPIELRLDSGGSTLFQSSLSSLNYGATDPEQYIQIEGGNVLSAPLKDGSPGILVGEGNAFTTWLSLKDQNLFDTEQIADEADRMREQNLLSKEEIERNSHIEKTLLNDHLSDRKYKMIEKHGMDKYLEIFKNMPVDRTDIDPYRFQAEINRIKELYGNKFNASSESVVLIPQKDFHIDMAIRPGLNGQVFLDSPSLTVSTIDEILANPQNKEALGSRLPIDSRSMSSIASLVDVSKDGTASITEAQLLKLYRNRAELDKIVEDKLYPILLSRLESAGYDVVPVPGQYSAMTDYTLESLTSMDENGFRQLRTTPLGKEDLLANGIKEDYLPKRSWTSNFMNAVTGKNQQGENYYITNSSPSELLELKVRESLQQKGIENVYFIGGGSISFNLFPEDPLRPGRPSSATESLSMHHSGLDCQTLEFVKTPKKKP